jgi:cytochrome c55X
MNVGFAQPVAGLLAGLIAAALWTLPAGAADLRRDARLIRFVRQDCGSCHGMSLQGGLGPPLLPAALRDRPIAGLVATVRDGRRGTAMPAWGSLLSEDEVEWIVAQLVAGFPEQRE